jgi:cytochrome c peroxidase
VREVDTPRSTFAPFALAWIAPCDIRVILFTSKINHRLAPPAGNPTLKLEVRFCVQGVNILERGSQVHAMAEFEELLDFPPAPKLDVFGKLIPSKATAAELRGQAVFFGKGRCGECHQAPFYTDNLMHNLQVERFYKPQLINNMMASADGPIKTFPLRGIKDSPPYLHDERLLTLDDTVEFFNIVLETKLTKQQKSDLVAFMRAL